MKTYILFLTIIFLFFLGINIQGQVTNLVVNNSTSSFTMISGDVISWSYNVPAGAATYVEIWYDVNGNGSIDAGDIIWQVFEQVDGDTVGSGGPPDMNSTAGSVSLSQPVGLAPGKYVMRFTQNNQSAIIAGTVTPLSSPAHTISGTVTPPPGKSAANIFVEVRRDNKNPNFWDAITDANGNYSIQMNSDTAGNPWRVSLMSDPFPPNIVTPEEDSITISGNPSGINFSFILAAAQVAGTVKDENGNLLPGTNVYVTKSNNSSTFIQHSTKTDANGAFQIGLLADELGSGYIWQAGANTNGYSDTTQNELSATAYITSISTGDSIHKDLVIYNVNSFITGTVKLDGAVPGFQVKLLAFNQDSALSMTFTNSLSGAFTLRVTDKIYNYQIFPINVGQNLYFNSLLAHPGNAGITFNLSTTPMDVKSVPVNLPKQYSLGQNYPNPFNPVTTIQYQIPVSGLVTLTVYNIIGQKITQLVNEVKPAGKYNVEFNSKNLSSGIYFYKLSSGSYSSIKKMILLK